jgi:hypothetical protein
VCDLGTSRRRRLKLVRVVNARQKKKKITSKTCENVTEME